MSPAEAVPFAAPKQRFHYLDGLRGIAAVAVAIFHFFCAFAPQLTPDWTDHPAPIVDSPLAVAWNGGFAVAIFFVLSGFVIANSAARRHLPLAFNLAQRYFRLAVPVLVSTLAGWVMIHLFRDTISELRHQGNSEWLQAVYSDRLPGLGYAVYHGVIKVFVTGQSRFNNVLWTMRIELLGSCLIYLLYGLDWQLHRVLVALTVVLCASGQFEYASFAVGAMLREASAARRLPDIAAFPLLVIGLLLGATMEGFGQRIGLGLLQLPLPGQVPPDSSLAFGAPHRFWHLVGSTMIVFAFLRLRALQQLFSRPLFRFLGEISFGFYLGHVLLIYSVVARFYLWFHATEGVRLLATFAVFMVLAIPLGYAFTVAVDRPVMRAIHRAQRAVLARSA